MNHSLIIFSLFTSLAFIGCQKPPAEKPALALDLTHAEVVVAPKAVQSVEFAGFELTNFLSRVAGEAVPLVREPSGTRFPIYVGASAWSEARGLDPAALDKDDAFYIDVATNGIALVGRDADYRWFHQIIRRGQGVGMFQGPRASLFAVYRFLEDAAGCRFYFPGELGEVVPRAKTLRVPLGRQVHSPDFVIRKYYSQSNGEWISGNEYTDGQGHMLNWLRLRMGSFSIPCCHGLNRYYYKERFEKSHPEYFALKPNGTRFLNYEGYPASSWGMLCFSSAITNEIYQDVKSYLLGEDASVRKIHKRKDGKYEWGTNVFGGKYCDIMPNDSMAKCQCAACKAKYVDSPDGNYATDLIWGMTAAIGRRLIAEKVPGYVTQMSYHPYNKVPNFDLPTNVLVMVAKSGPWSMRQPQNLARQNADIRAWADKVGRNIWTWTYPNKHPSGGTSMPDIPQVSPWAWGEYYKMNADVTIGTFAESETDRFYFNHLNYYVFSKVCWDNRTDVNAVLDEYFKLMYGAAAEEAKTFFKDLEDKWLSGALGQTVDTAVGPVTKVASVHALWTDIYSPEVLAGWGKLLDAGAAKLADGSLASRRFALMRRELLGTLEKGSNAYLDKTDVARNVRRLKETPPANNLVANGDFEIVNTRANRPDGCWYHAKWDARAGIDPTMAVVGQNSLKIVGTNDSECVLYYLDGRSGDRLKPNTRYRLSFFIKTLDVKPAGGRGRGGAGVTLCDAFNRSFPEEAQITGTHDWMHQTFEFKTDPETNRRCKSYIYLRLSQATGTVWFDAVRLEELGDAEVKPGACTVVVDPKASTVTRFAAEELAKTLTRRFSGREVPVRSSFKEGEFAFVVGDSEWTRAAGIDVAKLPRDAFRVKADLANGRLYIAGRDEAKNLDVLVRCRIGDIRFERGSLNGVYDFLEREAECRFYFPGELGEIVPVRESLMLAKDLDYESKPDFTARRVYDGPGSLFFEKNETTDPRFVQQLRNRMESITIPCCHGVNAFMYLKRFAKTHPEYFALSQGVRQTDPNTRHPGQLCYSSAVREEIYQDAKAYLTGQSPETRQMPAYKSTGFAWNYNCVGGQYVDVMPQDALTVCQCADCQKKITNAASKNNYATELIWDNVIDWGYRLKKEGVPGHLTMMSYHPYQDVPKREMPDNIDVMVAVTGPFGENSPERQKKNDARIKAWADKLGHKVWLWTYPNKYGPLELPGIPPFSMRAWGKFYADRKDLIFGAFAECESERWFGNHLNQYVFGRVMWDNAANVGLILEEYVQKMFGSGVAGWYMGEIISDLEKKWMKEVAGNVTETPLGPVMMPPSNDELWTKVYSPAFVASIDTRLTNARRSALSEKNELAVRRIDLYRQEIYEPLKAASDAYFAHKKAVDALPVWKAGERIPLVPHEPKASGVWGKKPKVRPERDIKTDVTVTRTEKELVFDFDCQEPKMDQILAVTRAQDDRYLWQDNGVEFFLNPSGDRRNYYQIIVNSAGSITDIKWERLGQEALEDRGWTSHAKIDIQKGSSAWHARIAVPLDAIPEPIVSPMPVGFCRSRILKTGSDYQQLFIDSPLAAKFGDILSFAKLAL